MAEPAAARPRTREIAKWTTGSAPCSSMKRWPVATRSERESASETAKQPTDSSPPTRAALARSLYTNLLRRGSRARYTAREDSWQTTTATLLPCRSGDHLVPMVARLRANTVPCSTAARVPTRSIRATVPSHIHSRPLAALKQPRAVQVPRLVARCRDSRRMGSDLDSRRPPLQTRRPGDRRYPAASLKASSRSST